MIIYKDIFTYDPLISDVYHLKTVGNGIAYEVDGKDVGPELNNIEDGFQLYPSDLDRGAYPDVLKNYLKSVGDVLGESRPDAVEEFKKGSQEYAKTILDNLGKYDFLVGESKDKEGMIILKGYREDGSPYYTFWVHGLEETVF